MNALSDSQPQVAKISTGLKHAINWIKNDFSVTVFFPLCAVDKPGDTKICAKCACFHNIPRCTYVKSGSNFMIMVQSDWLYSI